MNRISFIKKGFMGLAALLIPKALFAAQATITITITDSPSASLADIRDTLCIAWAYPLSLPQDNASKLAFLKQHLVDDIVNSYTAQKQAIAAAAASSIATQVNVQ
jgi:hypothetical protein